MRRLFSPAKSPKIRRYGTASAAHILTAGGDAKEVINLCDGCRLGCVGDVEVTVPEGSVKALIVFGPCRFFGLFGRGEDYYIPWECVQKFGDDFILVDKPFRRDPPPPPRRKKGWLF